MNTRSRITTLLILILSPAIAAAQSRNADYSVKLNASALQPGQTAVMALVIDIKPGLHVQSHTPLALPGQEPVKFDVNPTPNAAVEFLPPVYPEQKFEDYPGLGKESVYDGRVVVYIPIRIKTDAPLGPIFLNGAVTFQACNDKVCFIPDMRKPFSISTQIVPATQSVTPNDAALFSKFDQSVFANGAAPIVPTDTSTPINFFGFSFHLAKSQFGLALLVALSVGIIFNLVPCVLPVVPLKAIGFFEVSQHSRGKCFLLGVVFSLGVVSVFAVLAALLIPLRSVTHYSWGEQFQFGWFVWPLVVILVGMSLGMFGLFEVVLPSGIYKLSPQHDTFTGNYLFGGLTAILSTPCTAPMFVGILAWSVAQPTALGVSVVITVGIGMALPYLILSAFPALAGRVPRTGPWSAVLKQMMGFLVLAVAVYFAGGRIASREQMLWAVFTIICAAMAFLLVQTLRLSPRPTPIISALASTAIVVGISFWFIHGLVSGLQWQPYSKQAFDAARNTGRPVLVEFTANWCGNCIALEGTVYHDPQTAAAIRDRKIILLRADVTTSDAPGWDIVNQLNPGGGIPLTAIYGPGQNHPITLTSLYTTNNLIDAMNRAIGQTGS